MTETFSQSLQSTTIIKVMCHWSCTNVQ